MVQTGVAPGPGAAPTPGPRRSWWRLNFPGLVLALAAVWLSLTPSLLPRPWLYEGLIAGIAAAIGYGLGVLVSWALRRPSRVEPGPAGRRRAWWALVVVWPVAFLAAIHLGGQAQNEVRRLVGEDQFPPAHIMGIAGVCLTTCLMLVVLARGVRRLNGWMRGHLGRFVHRRLAEVLAFVIILLLGYWLTAGVLFTAFVTVMDTIYASRNDGTRAGIRQPTAATRSGSPESGAAWETLGYEGRSFVGRGPTAEEISTFTGQGAQAPIRVYVGLDTAPSAQARAEVAVAELQRTGAFDRAVLVVAGAAGTGWIEPQSTDALEYMWGGNTAFVTTQYSYLPSWISFLVDEERARDAGRALFEAVYATWSTLPEDERPKLLAYGLSLGSYAAQAPFSGVQDLASRTDGALFVGTPNVTQPWATITEQRDSGSPEWQPVHQEGAVARFAAAEGDLEGAHGPWPGPRVVFMQHASDPVLWWSPRLLSRRPDWLAEPRGPDVSPGTRWFPIITFLQVTVDQFFGVTAPPGHGHNYTDTIVYAWSSVLAPPGWTPQEASQLQEVIDAMPLE